jgi:hypothetical protein
MPSQPPSRSLLPPPLRACLALALTIALLSGCGGTSGADSGGVTHIKGSSASITRPMLNHWMQAMAGGDFRASGPQIAPLGLVSEPADYPRCEAAAKKIVPKGSAGQLKLTGAQIAEKCHVLYRAIKAQAISFLLSVQWTVLEGEEFGLKVSEAKLHKEFARYRKLPYPTEEDLRKFMAERRWVLSDILYQLKRNILVTEILPKFQAKVKKAGGGQATYVRLALARYRALIAKTSCEPGYVAPGCREYHGPEVVKPSPNMVLEQFAKGEA